MTQTSRSLALAFVTAVGTATIATPAAAQICLGLPGNDAAPMNLSAVIGFPDGAKTYGARFGAGSDKRFGGVSVSRTSADDADVSSTGVGVDGGLTLPMSSSSVRVCPVASLTYERIPETLGVKVSGTTAQAGMQVGGQLVVNPSMSVVPFAGARVVYTRASVSGYGESESESDTGGVLVGGFGLQFNRIFTVAPTISIPVGFESSDATFGIQASIGFGKR
ncbi:MAG: hypothetical protein LCH84_09610 [Gemmatimonadetes bacterium]|nr:hypothetical protein [Gemmatimonadota bacterium]